MEIKFAIPYLTMSFMSVNEFFSNVDGFFFVVVVARCSTAEFGEHMCAN